MKKEKKNGKNISQYIAQYVEFYHSELLKNETIFQC